VVHNIHVLSGAQISDLLHGREDELISVVQSAYELHYHGCSSLPHSSFLRLERNSPNRIIALPAYLGGQKSVAGLKWIASFPDNLKRGLERASAVIILNSTETGQPVAILEGSVISAKRTAASAALAARSLVIAGQEARLGFVGCGRINQEAARFLSVVFPGIQRVLAFDVDCHRTERFQHSVEKIFPSARVDCAASREHLMEQSSLISIATTATSPYVDDLSMCAPGTVLLGISLRDLSPSLVLKADNVVDDADHVCREQTSVHLAEMTCGNRDFIRCSLAEITLCLQPARMSAPFLLFSPFGLGVLDIAVSARTLELASMGHIGQFLDQFSQSSY
jgi:N-[(2S)-2-amino-2-carboxyethyl]-L-glutamate dehydrogenase